MSQRAVRMCLAAVTVFAWSACSAPDPNENDGGTTCGAHCDSAERDLQDSPQHADRAGPIPCDGSTTAWDHLDAMAVQVDGGISAYCSPVFVDRETCESAFAYDGRYNVEGRWAVSVACCACATRDCGAPCWREGDCEGPCLACGAAYECSDCRAAPGYCGPSPGEGYLVGCFNYLDAVGDVTPICADPF